MRIRNLLAVAMTIGIGPLCAQAQQREDTFTFTDHFKQTITISRFGTVLRFKNSGGRVKAIDNTFRICACPGVRCIEPTITLASRNRTEFRVDSPDLKAGETLTITAIVHGPVLTVTRQLTWAAGSSVVNIKETLFSPRNVVVCGFVETVSAPIVSNPCPPPPGASPANPAAKCPPIAVLNPTTGKSKLIKTFRIKAGIPLSVDFAFDLRN